MNIIKRLFTYQKRKREREAWDQKQIDQRFERLNDEICRLKKLAKCREHKIINFASIMYFSFDGGRVATENLYEARRQELRAEGYEFCHRDLDGRETWARYDPSDKIKPEKKEED